MAEILAGHEVVVMLDVLPAGASSAASPQAGTRIRGSCKSWARHGSRTVTVTAVTSPSIVPIVRNYMDATGFFGRTPSALSVSPGHCMVVSWPLWGRARISRCSSWQESACTVTYSRT